MFKMVDRVGVHPKFPKPKSYLKSYVLGPKDVQTEEVERLQRYAREGPFSFRYAPELSEHIYTMSVAASSLVRVAVVKRWQATQKALGGREEWVEIWSQSIAYRYWADRFNYRFHIFALQQFQRGERPQKLQMMFLHLMGGSIANCLALGWSEWAIDLTRRVEVALDKDLFNDGGDVAHRRTQHFVLRLVSDWQGWPPRSRPKCAFDEPLFNALIEHWREPNPADLSPLLLAACDRHTHQARPDNNKSSFDLPYRGMEYDPFEILIIYRLREMQGLANPALDHPVMNTPLGQLRPSTKQYSDPLLDGVLARARLEFADL